MMRKIYILSFFLVSIGGCSPFGATENTPAVTQVPQINTATLEPTIMPTEEPITFDFGGKSIYTQIYFDDFESVEEISGEIKTPGLRLYGNASVTTNEQIDGESSVSLSDWGSIETDPDKIQLLPNTRYIFEFDYEVISPGVGDVILWNEFRPEGSTDPNTYVRSRPMLSNAELEGKFSGGSLTGSASPHALFIIANENVSIIIDNLKIYRQDTIPITHQPQRWSKLSNLPYPRLGNYIKTNTTYLAQGAPGEGVPLTYSVKEIEDRLAMYDVIIGLETDNQIYDTDVVRRLRVRNPDLVILSARIFAEQGAYDLQDDFGAGVTEDWIVKDTNGNPVVDPVWNMYQMDISPYAPLIDGRSFNDFHKNWVINTVMGSGMWDGIWFDNLFGQINYHIPNSRDQSLMDYDVNRNGIRDETRAQISEIFRDGAIEFLRSIRAEVGDLEIIMGNAGPFPDRFLAPYVNGYLFECWNNAWNSDFPTVKSEASWRRALDEYFTMQSQSRKPGINVLQGCGTIAVGTPEGEHLEPTSRDIKEHRFTLGTALLGEGFYEYDLWGFWSAPYWFDEYTVNENGVAVEDQAFRGYLGQALDQAVELSSPGKLIWEEKFDAGTSLTGMWAEPGAYVSENEDEVLDGSGSLIIDNPDHTQVARIFVGTVHDRVVINTDETYLLEFDWKVLESIDGSIEVHFWSAESTIDFVALPGVITGDNGHAELSVTMIGSNPSIGFALTGGGGKIAIDNIRLIQGSVGPWRRDFEKGFVLVNPFNRSYAFSLEELAGSFNRNGIKRILGAQAPDVNNGQFVTDSLILEPFDAIILLADKIPVE